MEQNKNRFAPEAPADESASSLNPASGEPQAAPPDPPDFEPPPVLSDSLDGIMEETLAETFPEGCRKPRHDGWTPAAVGIYLRTLAATGVVEHAARAAGRSAASAYAFRNRRQGRAFAMMWDAVLLHRTRARIASELQGRAIAGCVSVRKRDGEVVGEYHYYDNRLAMAMLTRLDRLAEREAASDAQLRALSEDLDDYIDCLAEGGDGDAFVDARAPAEPKPEPAPAPAPPDNDPELTQLARLSGCPDYRDVDPNEIEVRDLDPSAKGEWTPEQWVRAYRSGFMFWLECLLKDDPAAMPGPGAPLFYWFSRDAALAAAERGEADQSETVDTADLDPAAIWDWTDDQLARAWRSGLLGRLPLEFWDDLATKEISDGGEE